MHLLAAAVAARARHLARGRADGGREGALLKLALGTLLGGANHLVALDALPGDDAFLKGRGLGTTAAQLRVLLL